MWLGHGTKARPADLSVPGGPADKNVAENRRPDNSSQKVPLRRSGLAHTREVAGSKPAAPMSPTPAAPRLRGRHLAPRNVRMTPIFPSAQRGIRGTSRTLTSRPLVSTTAGLEARQTKTSSPCPRTSVGLEKSSRSHHGLGTTGQGTNDQLCFGLEEYSRYRGIEEPLYEAPGHSMSSIQDVRARRRSRHG